MPTISRFYGIVIAMYFGDHPPPHFHAWFSGHRGRIAIASGEPIDGDLPPRALRLIKEWCEMRRRQLDANWQRAEAETPLKPIGPLP
jgi:hypothetical protein